MGRVQQELHLENTWLHRLFWEGAPLLVGSGHQKQTPHAKNLRLAAVGPRVARASGLPGDGLLQGRPMAVGHWPGPAANGRPWDGGWTRLFCFGARAPGGKTGKTHPEVV